MLYKIGVLKNSTKSTGKYLYQNLFFNRVVGVVGVFPVNFVKFSKFSFLQNTSSGCFYCLTFLKGYGSCFDSVHDIESDLHISQIQVESGVGTLGF